MGNTVLEQPDSPEQPVVPEEPVEPVNPEQPTGGGEEQPPEETPAEPAQPEPTIEIGGQQVPLSRAQEALDRYAKDEKWTAKNTQRAQELAQRERELSEALFLAERVKGRPDLIQKLLVPQEERNIEQELQQHYAQRPDGSDVQKYFEWEEKKDALLAEKAELKAYQRAEKQVIEGDAKRHNDDLVNTTRAAWVKEGRTVEDHLEAQRWILANVKSENGKYLPKHFEWAKRELFGDEAVRSAKIEGSKKAAEAIEKAKPANPTGAKPKIEQSDLSDEDQAFLEEMSARTRKAS